MNHIVLLGDSIFDNAAYVPGGPPLIAQLRSMLPEGWQATLVAMDGSVTSGVITQIDRLPVCATHLIVSAGGNDGLSRAGILQMPVASVGAAIEQLAALRAEFQRNYQKMLQALQSKGKPFAICTVYDPCFPDSWTQLVTKTALNIFNDCILREGITRGLPVLDLRLICSEGTDYANPIEPGVPGGQKIAAAILELVRSHDFSSGRTVVYC
ncbi:MAG TPA: SGNH/GDSL hydrolase family protein [Verrucomicrobiae bacterium]|nr:SGNH/GDSL hydrolase family protein [Verrucomicrobiae bacterium]